MSLKAERFDYEDDTHILITISGENRNKDKNFSFANFVMGWVKELIREKNEERGSK